MAERITQYISKNGIRLHHLKTDLSGNETEITQPHMHHFYEIFVILSGSAEYKINAKCYNPSPMEMIIVPPNTIHSVKYEQSCERISFLFSPSLFPDFVDLDIFEYIAAAKTFSYTIPKKYVEEYELLDYILNASAICKKNEPYIDLNLLILILKFIQELNTAIQNLKNNELEKKHSVKTYRISYNVIRYIQKHLTQKITLTDIAKELDLSESYVRQTFKKEIGVSINDYLLQQKMELARQLLLEGESPMRTAELLGYEYYSTFHQQYVKKFRVPPKEAAKIDTKRLWTDDNTMTST